MRLPSNIEVEKYIIGCLLLEEQCADYIPKLNDNDFSDTSLRALYGKASNLYEDAKPINLINLAGTDVNAITYLTNICDSIPTTASFKYHFKQLKDLTYRREVIKQLREINDLVLNSEYDDTVDLRNNVLQKIDIPIFEPHKATYEMKSVIKEAVKNIQERFSNKNEERLYTGFYDLDKNTAGLHPEEMTILAARPGIGKTAFIMQMLIQVAMKGNSCALFSREMSRGQLGERVLSHMSGVDSQKIRFAKNLTDDEIHFISLAEPEAGKLPIVINDEAVNVQEIRAYCRELKSKGKLDVIAIDYLQLCRTLKKTQSREREVAEMSWEFKMLSKEFKVPVIVLSQLNREITKASREPVLSDLRDSGSIEQDSDNVIFLHVPKDTDETANVFDIKVIIAKQRNGPVGSIWLKYQKNNFKFMNIARGAR